MIYTFSVKSGSLSLVYDHWVRLDECIFGADLETPPHQSLS